MQRSGTSVKSIFLSVLLHLGAAALLVISIYMNTRTFRQSHPEIVQAVTVDNKEIEKELQKLRELDDQKQKKQQEAERKLKEAEQQLATAEQQRKQEEIRLTEAKKKQAQEQKKREEEQKKLAQIKQQQEDLEQKRKREAEQAEAERKRKEQDAAKQKQLAEEQKARSAAQAQQDQQFKNNFSAEIKRRVSNNFNISGLPAGLKCVILVRVIPGGEIINASINRSSGNDIFDSRALVAVQKAAPLPVPSDAATLDRLGLRQFLFDFEP